MKKDSTKCNDGRDKEYYVDKNDEGEMCDAQKDNANEDNNNGSINVVAPKPCASIGSTSSDGNDDNTIVESNGKKYEVVSVPVITCQNRPMTRSATRCMES